MKITFTFMHGQKTLARLEGKTEPGTELEKFIPKLLEVERKVNEETSVRLHIWTEPEASDHPGS